MKYINSISVQNRTDYLKNSLLYDKIIDCINNSYNQILLNPINLNMCFHYISLIVDSIGSKGKKEINKISNEFIKNNIDMMASRGSMGLTDYSGYSGYSGYGYSGYSGYDGYSGYSGHNSDLSKLIDTIAANYNPYENKNTVYENVYKNLWDSTLKNLSEEDKKIQLFIDPTDFPKYQLNVPEIESFLTSQGGGYNQYESVGIALTVTKPIGETRKTIKKYIVTSLFDGYFGDLNIPANKNINHYAICLYESIKLYNKYLPDFNIRLYGDLSLSKTNENVKKLFDLIESSDYIEYVKVDQNFNNISGLHKNGGKYVGLLGAFYRYYALLDPAIEHCLVVDADNFPTESFIDIVTNWVNERDDSFLIFKPLYYARKNINDDCIQQILAGMSGFKKPLNKIVNPLIFKKMFEYMSIQYNKFKLEFKDNCDNNKPIKYGTPFTFGFEEQALTNILLPYFILNKIRLAIIPMYFDFGSTYKFYYDEILNLLNDDYRDKIKEKLGINNTNTQLLTYVEPLYGYNIHIGIILVNFVNKCIKNNKNIFKDFNKVKKLLSIKGFYHMYPSFNILLQIEKIDGYINDLYNNTNNLPNIEPRLLTDNAKSEFGRSTSSYDSYIDPGKHVEDFMREKPVLDILKSSDLYRNKYLKYKHKYLELKKLMKIK